MATRASQATFHSPLRQASSPQHVGNALRPYGGLHKAYLLNAVKCAIKGRGEHMGRIKSRPWAGLGRADAIGIAALCVGYGAYHACCYNGAIYRTCLYAQGLPDISVWACIGLLVAFSGVGCLVVRALHGRGIDVVGRTGMCASYAAMAVLTVLGHTAGSSPAASYLLASMMGLATCTPLLLWFEQLLSLYHKHGPGACMLAMSCGELLGHAPELLLPGEVEAASALALLLGGTCLAAAFQFVALTRLGRREEVGPHAQAVGKTAHERYRLSVYIVALVASFGAVTGLASGITFFLSSGVHERGVAPAIAAVAAFAFLVALSLLANKGAALHFGLLIRVALVIAGVAFAFAPLLLRLAPTGLAALCQAVNAVQGVAMTLLSVEICHERGLAMSDVMPANYAIYVVCVCCGMGACAFAGAVGGDYAWQLVFALAATSIVAVIPTLPSSSSSAATFTAKVLLENERYEARASRVCRATAARYSLTPRETDVLELLLMGRTRAEIADALSLSAWTVKEYVGSIYGKVGVHSAKDLMVRCMAQAGSPKEE